MAIAWKWACGAIAATVIVPAASAQSPRADMDSAASGISGYSIEGPALLNSGEFTRIIAPYVGRNKSTTDVERAGAALQQAYHDLGQCDVRIEAANSSLPGDVVAIRVTEIASQIDRDCLPTIEFGGGGGHVNPAWRRGGPPAGDPPSSRFYGIAGPAPGAADSGSATVAAYAEGGGERGLLLVLDNSGPEERRVPIGSTGRATDQGSPVILAMSESVSGFPVTAPLLISDAKDPLLIAREIQPRTEADTSRPVGHRDWTIAQAAPSAVAPAAPVAAPKFEIRAYVVEGNTLLPRETIDRALAPFAGKNKDFADVQHALEALQNAYQSRGFGSVEIRLPEQELERGEVRFVAIEAKIGKILVEGNEHFTTDNIRRSVPALREGTTPNSREIAQSIRLANENPAKQSTVLLKGTEQDGQIDAAIRVADVESQRYSVSLDNTGNEDTGRFRLGLAYQNANVFDRDHVLTAQFLTSPANPNDVNVYGVGYRVPLYSRGDSIDVVAGYSDVNSGTVQNLFNVTGKGAVYALRYNQGLSRWRDVEHKLTYGLDYRAYQNNVNPVGGNASLVPDITVHPISATYLASLRQEKSEWTGFVSIVRNIPGGSDGTDEIFKMARFPAGTASYRLYRFGGSFSRAIFGEWQARIRLDAQYTEDALVTGEQFAIGGADNVRGFNERYVSNDKGYRTNWEIYTPDWGKRLRLSDGRMRFLAFYDTGVTYRNQPQPGERDAASLDSWGLGVRLSYKNNLTARMDVAHVLHDGSQGLVSDGRRNLTIVHFSTAWVW